MAPGTETCRANYGGYAGFAAGNGVYLNPDYALDLTTGWWAMIQSLCAQIMKVCMQQAGTTPTRQSCVNCQLYCAAYVQPIMLTQDSHGGSTDAAVADDFEYAYATAKTEMPSAGLLVDMVLLLLLLLLVKHELAHVTILGLHHANWISKYNKFEEYGDLTTPMGISCGNCSFSAPELVQLGWAPLTQDRILYWSTVKAGTKFTFNLSPLADSSSSIITVLMQFGPSGNVLSSLTTGTTQELYLSYRVAKGQDNGLDEKYSQATSVHTVNRLGTSTGQNHNIILVAWLKTGWAFIDHSSQLVVFQDSGDDTGASVVLCRYTHVPRDCGDSFVDFGTVPEAEAGVAETVSAAMALRFPGAGNAAAEAANSDKGSRHY